MTLLTYAGLRFGFVLVGALAAISCRPNHSAGSPEAVALELAEADRTLQGTWLLLEAQPNPALDPVLGSLLAAQFGQMRITFSKGLMTAQGVGLQFKRDYRVTSVEPNGQMHMMLRDNVGDTDDADGRIEGEILKFNGRSSPWNGTGRLRRLGR